MIPQDDRPYLSLTIPAYNEALRLRPSLERVLAYLRSRDFATELIIVDDGSSDGTADVARAMLEGQANYRVLRNEPNLGKALSVKRGLLEGQGKVVLFSDADLSTPIEEADKLLAELAAGADVAIASRQLPGSRLTVHQPWYRELGGKAFGWLNQAVLLPGIPDSQCGFKAFTRDAAHRILAHQKLSGWAFDAELLYIARKLGLKIAQVPVTWINDPNSKVKMLRDGLRMAADLLRVKRLHRDLREADMSTPTAGLPAPVREAHILETLLRRATITLPESGRLIGKLGLPDNYAEQAIALGAPAPPAPSEAAAQMRGRYYSFGEYTPAHTTLNHPLLLSQGLGGVIARLAAALPAASGASRDMLEGMRIALEAVCRWAERHAEMAEQEAELAAGAERERFGSIARICRRVPRHPARSFHEALQTILFARMATGLSERCTASLSLGRLDQDVLGFYEQDLAGGVAPAELEELLAEFFTHLNHFADPSCAVNLGGLDAARHDQFNDLSDLIVRTAVRLHLPSPLLVARVHRDLPSDVFDALTQPALVEMGQPTYYGEEPCREALRRRGVPEADLPGWLANSCMGLMMPGEEISDMWGAVVNAPLALELATTGGEAYLGELPLSLDLPGPPLPEGFAGLRDRFLLCLDALLEWALSRNAAATAWVAEHWPNPFLSALTADCLERGLDRAGGGARYHLVTVEVCGLVNVADALTALRRLVFEEGRYTLAELVAAAGDDYAGREDLRQELLAQPKWGNGDRAVDDLLAQLATHFARRVSSHSHGNRVYGPSFHTLNAHLVAGAQMAASLDGRKAGQPLAKNMGSTPGLARAGHTKLVLSATTLDQRDFCGGQALDLSLDAASLRLPEDRRKFQALLLTYFERGGLEVQVNGVTAAQLRQAIADPAAHRDLTVRIAGYSARFVGLSATVQEEMVRRFEAGL